MSKQAALPLAWPKRYGVEDFVAAECNAQAFACVKDVSAWKTPVLLIQGAPDSGKTHLASIYMTLHNAHIIRAPEDIDLFIETESVEGVPTALIDGVDGFIRDYGTRGASALFHLVNHMQHNKGHLLLTSQAFPAEWLAQPDLLSRLQASQTIALENPSEDMIKAAYQKMFLDRGLLVDHKVLDYISTRSERCFSDIRENVEKLDVLALEEGRKVTIPLIQKSAIFDF